MGWQPSKCNGQSDGDGQTVANANECGHARGTPEPEWRPEPGAAVEGPGSPLGEPSGTGLSRATSERQERLLAGASYWPPDRTYRGEWPSELEPAVRRVADGMAPWVDRLRLTGNGVVPLAAAVAFLRLRARLTAVDDEPWYAPEDLEDVGHESSSDA